MKRPVRAAPPAPRADGAPARPKYHLDIVALDEGRCFVAGWAVRRAAQDPEVLLLDGVRPVAPLVTFSRPDVIEYFTYNPDPDVARSDAAFGFVFATPAQSLDSFHIGVQGSREVLRDFPRGDKDDISFLKRYLEAMRPLAGAPSVDAARAYFIRRLVAGGLADAAREAAGDAFDEDRMSAQALLAGCKVFGPAFRKGASLGRRAALLAIHQAGSHLTRSHMAMLRALAAHGYQTVLINSRQDSRAGFAELEQGQCAGIVTRADHGRDFASWLLAVSLLGARLGSVGEALFCNDSFLGPFDDLASTLAHASRDGADAWALTDSWERGWHLQSSFFTLSDRAVASDAFRGFAETYAYPNERDAVVREGELGMSRALLRDASLRLGVVAPYAHLAAGALAKAEATMATLNDWPGQADLPLPDDDEEGADRRWREDFLGNPVGWTQKFLSDLRRGLPRNPQHVFWEVLLTEYRIPFVKRELMLSNPAGIPDYFRILGAIGDTFGAEHAADAEADMRAGARRAPVR